jgi:hypothetical protein
MLQDKELLTTTGVVAPTVADIKDGPEKRP